MWGIWVDILFNLKQIGFLGSHVIWKNSGCVLESDRSQPSPPKPGGGSNKFLRRSIWSQLFLLSMVLVYFLQNKIGKLNRRTYDTETVTTVARTKVFFFWNVVKPIFFAICDLKKRSGLALRALHAGKLRYPVRPKMHSFEHTILGKKIVHLFVGFVPPNVH